jgi:hypothetical protein
MVVGPGWRPDDDEEDSFEGPVSPPGLTPAPSRPRVEVHISVPPGRFMRTHMKVDEGTTSGVRTTPA